ncbi:MAG: YcxB family protein [Alistipes sp.]|nr:YcxB family protein [Alistipes sp.]
MRLEYDITLDEMMAFQRRALERNRQFQKRITRSKVMVPVLLLLIVFISVDFRVGTAVRWDMVIAELITVAVITCFFFLTVRRRAISRALGRVRKTLESPKNGIYLKKRTVELGEDGLCIETDESSDRLKWSMVHEVEELDTVFLLYISELSAHVIPKRILQEDEMTELRGLLERHVTPQPEK